ncbi:MAG: sulfur carrier protein ThiS [Planctomycetota bacterium]
MRITVNDESREVPDEMTVAELVASLALPSTRVAVEVDRQLVRRADHAGHKLQAGSVVEVVTLVGGG